MTHFVAHDWERIYRSNLEALKQRYPGIFEKLITADKKPPVNPVKLNPTDEFPDVLIENGGRSVFYYGHENPMAYCRQYLSSLDLHYAPVLVFMGFGLGYQVASALNSFAKDLDIRHVLIIEKDIELFRAAMTTIDFSSIINHPMVEFIVGVEPKGIFDALVAYYKQHPETMYYFKSLKIVIMPAARRIDAAYYEKAVDTLKMSMMFILQQLGNDPYDSVRGIDYTLKNMEPILHDPWINAFKNVFKGQPAVLVGAGPSLNKEIPLLKEASQKALIVCVDAALKPLLDHGITPHIVTNMERSQGQSGFFKGLDGLENTFFVYCAVVYPDTYASYHGPKIITHRYPEITEWLDIDMDALTGSPTVSNYAFNAAEYLGCDPIIMVGQDLSVPPTGSTHVEGMVFGTLHRYRKNLIPVEGNTGETLMATRSFIESRKSLEQQIENYGGLCINTTLNGAKINGAALMEFKDAMRRYFIASYDYGGHLKKIWTEEKNGRKEKKKDVNRLLSRLEFSLSEMKDALGSCKKGIDEIDDFVKSNDLFVNKSPNPAIMDRVKNLEKIAVNIRSDVLRRSSLRFLSTVFGGYTTNFCMRKNYLFDQFNDRKFAAMKGLLMEKDALTIMGQLLLSSIYSVQTAAAALKEAYHTG